VAFAWQGTGDERFVVAVNYAPNQSQCHARLPFADLGEKEWRLQDQFTEASYDWNGDDRNPVDCISIWPRGKFLSFFC
jgi:hypothetical protein